MVLHLVTQCRRGGRQEALCSLSVWKWIWERWDGSWNLDPSVNHDCTTHRHGSYTRGTIAKILTCSPLHVTSLLGWQVTFVIWHQRIPPTKKERKNKACVRRCLGWLPTMLCFEKNSVAIVILPSLLFILKLGLNWWYLWFGFLVLEFCILGCTFRALKILISLLLCRLQIHEVLRS